MIKQSSWREINELLWLRKRLTKIIVHVDYINVCKKCSYILKENLGQCASIELFTSSQTSQQKKRILNCTYFLQFVTTWCDQAAKRGKGRGLEGWEVDQEGTYPLIELFNPIYPPISIALNQDWVCCFVWCFRFLTSL